ncbi:YbaB/EbfC family nucleoid-associated protein [Amycolatopsis sp. cmx-4-68]|uniref:YbaB/EbfC family nucleoid-associated protein n=1 Tax=Amycolatopsis sp. cmx-4-68 TaxID=2790938 RepID=UPI00397CC6ED
MTTLDMTKLTEQAAELDAELSADRFVARSGNGLATATVSGQGELVGLAIAPDAIRGAHPQEIGPAVLDAVTTARRQASSVSLAKLSAVLDKDQDWQPQSQSPTTPASRPPTAPTRRPAPTDDDDSFDQTDFVTDQEPEKRGRW